MKISYGNCSRDYFHTLIFGIDKMHQFCIMKSTNQIRLLLPKGSDGLRKAFKSCAIQFGILLLEVSSIGSFNLPLQPKYFKGLPKKENSAIGKLFPIEPNLS
jgi:hypothetical protein